MTQLYIVYLFQHKVYVSNGLIKSFQSYYWNIKTKLLYKTTFQLNLQIKINIVKFNLIVSRYTILVPMPCRGLLVCFKCELHDDILIFCPKPQYWWHNNFYIRLLETLHSLELCYICSCHRRRGGRLIGNTGLTKSFYFILKPQTYQ